MSSDQFGNSSTYSNGAKYPLDSNPAHAYEAQLADDSMERIRELIIGDLRRTWDSRLHLLETRLQLLEDKLDALRHDTATIREEQLSGLAQGMEELGQHIRRLKSP